MLVLGFIKTIWEFLLNVFGSVIDKILNPIFDWLVSIGFVDDNFITLVNTYMNKVYQYIGFGIRVICNITGLSPTLFTFLGFLLLGFFTMFLGTYIIRFAFNGWALFRGSQGMLKMGGK